MKIKLIINEADHRLQSLKQLLQSYKLKIVRKRLLKRPMGN